MVHPHETHPDYDTGWYMALWSLLDAWYTDEVDKLPIKPSYCQKRSVRSIIIIPSVLLLFFTRDLGKPFLFVLAVPQQFTPFS